MRYLLITLGSLGDLLPYLVLGRALSERGHYVEVITQPAYERLVNQHGCSFTAACTAEDHRRTVEHPRLWHPVDGFGVLWRHLAIPSIEPVRLRVLRWQVERQVLGEPGHILASPLAIGARLAQAQRMVACQISKNEPPERKFEGLLSMCSVYTAPANLRWDHGPCHLGDWRVPQWWSPLARRAAWWALDQVKLEPLARSTLAERMLKLAIPPQKVSIFGRFIHAPHGGIALFPRSFLTPEQAAERPGLHHGGWLLPSTQEDEGPGPLPAPLERFLTRNERPVVIFGGSAGGAHAAHIRTHAIQACTALGRPMVILGAPEDHAAALNGRTDCLAWPSASLHRLLPRASAFVHHGGIGSVAQGLRAACWQIMCPTAYDQFDNAERLQQLGGGTVVRRGNTADAPLRWLEALQVPEGAPVTEPTLVGDGLDATLAALQRWQAQPLYPIDLGPEWVLPKEGIFW